MLKSTILKYEKKVYIRRKNSTIRSLWTQNKLGFIQTVSKRAFGDCNVGKLLRVMFQIKLTVYPSSAEGKRLKILILPRLSTYAMSILSFKYLCHVNSIF